MALGNLGLGAVHSSPRSPGFEDGHWGAVRARTPGRDPPRGPAGQPCPGGSRGGSRALEDPHRPAQGALGPGLWWAVGTSPMPVHGHTRVHTQTHTQVRAHTRSPARHTLTGPGGRQGPNSCPGRWGCERSFRLSPSGSRAGVLVQPLLPDWGAAPLAGPPPTPAAWLGPLSLRVPCPRRGQQCPLQGRAQRLLEARP